MAGIQFDDVTKRYDDGFEAVKHMNLEISDGEFMILVGPSGCGKSTALRMIAGLEDITDGELKIGDRVVNDKAPKDRDIAMVFQNYALYPHMTVRDNMGFALKIAGEDKATINQKVEEAATILDLSGHLDRKPANLSGGQRQRVAMGRAIVRSPSAFLMDEPLSNLDAKLRVQMRTEVSRIQQRLGVTTVYVTHDQTEAMTLGDRVAVMRAGQLQQVDSPKELYNNPRNIFVAGFIGSPSMNFFTAHVEGGKVRLPFGEVDLQEGVQAGGEVIAGIRPEDFEDASLDGRPPGPPRLRGPDRPRRVDGLGDLRVLPRRGAGRAVRRAGRAGGRLRTGRRAERRQRRGGPGRGAPRARERSQGGLEGPARAGHHQGAPLRPVGRHQHRSAGGLSDHPRRPPTGRGRRGCRPGGRHGILLSHLIPHRRAEIVRSSDRRP